MKDLCENRKIDGPSVLSKNWMHWIWKVWLSINWDLFTVYCWLGSATWATLDAGGHLLQCSLIVLSHCDFEILMLFSVAPTKRGLLQTKWLNIILSEGSWVPAGFWHVCLPEISEPERLNIASRMQTRIQSPEERRVQNDHIAIIYNWLFLMYMPKAK